MSEVPNVGDLLPLKVIAPLIVMAEVVSVSPIVTETVTEGTSQKVKVKYLHPMSAQWMEREVELDVSETQQPLIITN